MLLPQHVHGSDCHWHPIAVAAFVSVGGPGLMLLCHMWQAGVNATGEQVLEWLVRADTADAFNISLGDVSITGVQQVCLYIHLAG